MPSMSSDRNPPGSQDARPLGRFILCAVILLLGGVAAFRLPLQLLPSWTFPELRVVLSLPQEQDVDTEVNDQTILVDVSSGR